MMIKDFSVLFGKPKESSPEDPCSEAVTEPSDEANTNAAVSFIK